MRAIGCLLLVVAAGAGVYLHKHPAPEAGPVTVEQQVRQSYEPQRPTPAIRHAAPDVRQRLGLGIAPGDANRPPALRQIARR